MVNSSFVTDAEIDDMINYEMGDLYDLLVGSFEDHFISTSTIALVSGTENYNLPSDFYKLRAVFFKDAGQGQRWRLQRINIAEFEYDYEYYGSVGGFNRYMRYRILDDQIYFVPEPIGSGSIELFYVPEMTKISSDSTPISFNVPTQGWEQYVVAGTAARMLSKEESDPSALLAEQGRIKANIQHMAVNRDAASPERTLDVYGRFEPWGSRQWR